MNRKIALNYLLFIVLILTNIYILNDNIRLKSKISSLEELYVVNNPITMYDMVSTISILHSEVKMESEDILLSIFIPENSCTSCLEFEIPNISNLYSKFPEKVNVYVIEGSHILDGFVFDFTPNQIRDEEVIFDQEIEFSNPLAVLSNNEGEVLRFYIAEISRPNKSYNFL